MADAGAGVTRSATATVAAARRRSSISSAGRNVLLYSLCMVFVPFGIFFAVTQGAIDPIHKVIFQSPPTPTQRSYAGAILAVITVNAIVAGFVLTAFKEQPEPLKED